MTDTQMADRKKGHGCFFYGCITAIIISLVAAAGIGFVIYKVRGLMVSYTSTVPADIPVIQVSQEQLAALNTKIEDFKRAVAEDKPARLVLSADEINAELNSERGLQAIGGKAFVQIQGEEIVADFSIPTDFLALKGRYLNGRAKVVISLQAGRLMIFVNEINVDGRTVPESIMKDLRSRNLAEQAMADAKTADAISKIKRISVEDGSIVLER